MLIFIKLFMNFYTKFPDSLLIKYSNSIPSYSFYICVKKYFIQINTAFNNF